jgi:1,4-alpha-glucan branching enzyme
LAQNPFLRYGQLLQFDRALLALAKSKSFFQNPPVCLCLDEQKQVMVFERAGIVFAVNLHPTQSYQGYVLPVPKRGTYHVCFSSDKSDFGGWDRISCDTEYVASKARKADRAHLQIYLPARSAVCLKKK